MLKDEIRLDNIKDNDIKKRSVTKIFTGNKEIGLIIVTIILFILLSASSQGFLTYFNLANILRNVSLWVIIALAQALVLVIGGMNLSIGAIGALTAITTGYFVEVLNMPGIIAVAAALFVGIIAGFFNGIVIIKTGLNAFIVTLATLFIYTGIVMGLTKGSPFTKIPTSFTFIGQGTLVRVPYLFLLTIVIFIIVFILFRFTLIGRRILATGSNITAAKFSGINTDNIILFAHSASGFIAAIGGILYVSRYGVAQPSIGNSWLIMSFAIAIIGGTALAGGVLSILGLLFGGIIIILIKSGLILLHVEAFWEQAFLGVLILIAVGIDRVREIITSKRSIS